MPTIAEIRQQFPDYADMSDSALADALHKKFYSDIPKSDFEAKVGIKPAEPDVGRGTAIGRGVAQGLTLGGYDEMRGLAEAGGIKPDEPMSLGSLLRGGYRYMTGTGTEGYEAGRGRAAAEYKTAEQQYPGSTMAGNLGGAVAGVLPLGAVSLGARAAGAGTGLGRTILGSVIDGTALGAAQGALSADPGSRVGGAIGGSVLGGVVGGAAPAVLSVTGRALSPIMANLMAWRNPAGYAERQVGRAISESGRSVDDIAREIGDASAAGQGQFMLADALGNPGQRMLSTVARAPGEGRTAVVNALENRQAGQGRRISNAIMEGFDSPQTAIQTEARMTAARTTRADAEYGAVRNASEPVDLVGPINHLDRTIGTCSASIWMGSATIRMAI
ncbi:hypothetical protein FNL56_16295 [Tardiphaga sp. vice304]|uniref:hypothetical protein n=1 Tax=Tardiphaga sp. vice304 TaxID=2592817 RepID=UPI001162E88F|nr:hypothetical protein [Tardiphaga sp. vice304]QDM27506.1 hypothetical protein FNL56_16295 [Tardiphaga sp. vice304]